MHGLLTGGIALTGRLRGLAGQSGQDPAVPPALPVLPRPRKPRAARRPNAPVPAARPTRSGWFARWFGRNRKQPEMGRFPPWFDRKGNPFTPETCPGLSAEAYALLGTPVEECDPESMCRVMAEFATHIAGRVPSELGLDARALLATFWGCLGPLAAPARPDAPASAPADPPAPARDAPLNHTEDNGPAHDAAPGIAAASEGAPNTALPAAPIAHRRARRARRGRGWLFRHRCRLPAPRLHARRPRRLPAARQALPPRRLYYAACAGPP